MRWPEFLLRLSQRDQQVTWLDPFFARVQQSTAATVVTATLLTVPNDRAAILVNLSAGFDPGAAQNVVDRTFELVNPTSTSPEINIFDEQADLAADVVGSLNWEGEILVPPGWRVRCVGTFNAGVAANLVDASICAILIPAGNIQRV